MTSGVLTEPPSTDDQRDEASDRVDSGPDADGQDRPAVSEETRRRLARWRDADPMSWVAITVVLLIGAVLRLYRLAQPKGKAFDEVYYTIEARTMLQHFVEYDVKVEDGVETDLNVPRFVVHPPLGKWCIALGEKLFGYNEFGWRISAAVFGIASILIMILVARQLFRSTLLGCAAGLLLSMSGLHFVMSRTGMLDVFLMFFVVAAFACLVMDREHRRARWLVALEAGLDPNRRGRAGRPRFGFPWWRLGAAAMTGCACGVKWSGMWYLFTFLLLMLMWEVGARKTAGVRAPIADTIVTQAKWVVGFVAVTIGVYMLTWSGWFLTDDGFHRHWLRDTGHHEYPVLGALRNFWFYHTEAYKFHVGLTSPHGFQSWPWQWLLLGRSVGFIWGSGGPCGGPSCFSGVVLLGTPLLTWSFIPALAALTWVGISRRDWRAGAIGIMAAAGIVPWFWNEIGNRTMFYFYALPAEPFMVLAVVYVLGAIIGPATGADGTRDRRFVGALVAGAYVLVIAICFAYFYPIFSDVHLTYAQWYNRMWLGPRWMP